MSTDNDRLFQNFRKRLGVDLIWRFPENPSHCIMVRNFPTYKESESFVWHGIFEESGRLCARDGINVSNSDLMKTILELIEKTRPIPKE